MVKVQQPDWRQLGRRASKYRQNTMVAEGADDNQRVNSSAYARLG